jgi:hypothetical protein
MCYLARHQQAPLEEDAATTTTHTPSARPRWIGAAVATIVGGLALAAVLAPAVPPASADEASVGPVQPAVSNVSAAPVAERSSISPDDGVPTTTDVAKAGDSSCHHGL